MVSDKSIELQNLIQDLNAQLAAKSKEFDLEKEQFAKSQETNAQLIKVLEQRNAYLDSQLSGSQISTNIAITGHPNNRVTELETNIAKLQSEKSEISSKLAELDSKAQEWETKRDDYVRELNSLKEQVSALQGERLAAIQRADQLQSTITEAENFRKQILNEYQVVEGSVMELKSAKLQLDGKVKRLLSVK